MSRARGWVMTLNNFSEMEYRDIVTFMKNETEYGVIGIERGSSGTPHLQMHMEFKNMKSAKQLKAINNRMHIEKRKGTKEQAAEYCKKEGMYEEFGKLKDEKGKRNDLLEVKKAVQEGKTMNQIIEVAQGYQALKYAETLRKYICPRRDWKTRVYWLWGETGTGKSQRAFSMTEPGTRWISMDSLKWWDGYDGERDVIIEDFRGCDCKLKTLLRIFDRYEYRVEVKGGSTQLLAQRIFVTCPFPPEGVYHVENTEDLKQLTRRIEYVWHFSGNKCGICERFLHDQEECSCYDNDDIEGWDFSEIDES